MCGLRLCRPGPGTKRGAELVKHGVGRLRGPPVGPGWVGRGEPSQQQSTGAGDSCLSQPVRAVLVTRAILLLPRCVVWSRAGAELMQPLPGRSSDGMCCVEARPRMRGVGCGVWTPTNPHCHRPEGPAHHRLAQHEHKHKHRKHKSTWWPDLHAAEPLACDTRLLASCCSRRCPLSRSLVHGHVQGKAWKVPK